MARRFKSRARPRLCSYTQKIMIQRLVKIGLVGQYERCWCSRHVRRMQTSTEHTSDAVPPTVANARNACLQLVQKYQVNQINCDTERDSHSRSDDGCVSEHVKPTEDSNRQVRSYNVKYCHDISHRYSSICTVARSPYLSWSGSDVALSRGRSPFGAR